MALSPQAAALRAAIAGIPSSLLSSSSIATAKNVGTGESGAASKNANDILTESFEKMQVCVGLGSSVTQSSKGVEQDDIPSNGDASAGGICSAQSPFWAEVHRRRSADRKRRQADSNNVRQLLAEVQMERMGTNQASSSSTSNIVGNRVAAIEAVLSKHQDPAQLDGADGAAGLGIAIDTSLAEAFPSVAATPAKPMIRSNSSPLFGESPPSVSRGTWLNHDPQPRQILQNQATSGRRASLETRASTRQAARTRLQSPQKRFSCAFASLVPPDVRATPGSPSWTVYVENEPEVLPKRMHELPQGFGRQNHQEWAACLRRSFECPSHKIIKPWDDRKSCPRSFEGFTGKDIPHIRARSSSAPRLRGPGVHFSAPIGMSSFHLG